MKAYRRVWWTIAGLAWPAGCFIALSGVLSSALIVLSVLVGINAAAFTFASAVVDDWQGGRARAVARNAVLGVAATVAVIGLIAGLGGLGFLMCALFAGTSPPVAERLRLWRERRRAERGEAHVPDAEPRANRPSAPACAELSTAELVLAWRVSSTSLLRARTPSAANAVVVRRQCYLDELERRDPDGVRRWLDSGAPAPSDPSAYLRHDGGAGPPSGPA